MSFIVYRLSSVVLAAAILVCAWAGAASAEPRQERGQELVEGFLSALNANDPARLEAFIKDRWDNAMPAADRAKRAMGLAEQGAPFKLVKVVSNTGGKLKAIVEDKNAMQLGMILSLDSAGKIQTIMLGDPDELSAPPPKDYKGWTTLAALTESIRKDTDSPGMAVAYYHDGKVEQAASGVREVGKPAQVATSDVFSIGSIGKPITSTLIGRRIEMGKLNWDTTLGQALPNVPMKEEYKGVTLEQVMQHRGGIPQFQRVTRDDMDRFTAGGEKDPMKIRLAGATHVLAMDPIGKPGERFAYSNAGYMLLGVIAEQTMLKQYERLVHQLVLKPLGMDHTYTNGDDRPEGRVSGHVRAGEDAPATDGGQKWTPRNFAGPIEILFAPAGGGTWATAEDLVKFGVSHMKGLQGKDDLLKASTVQRLHQGVQENPSDKRSYACGWGIEKFAGVETMHRHNGSNGTQRSELAVFPKAGVVVAAIVNRGGEAEPAPGLQAVLAIAQKLAKG